MYFSWQDGFRFPSQAFYDDLVANQQLSKLDLDTYVRIIQAVFQELCYSNLDGWMVEEIELRLW